MKNENLCKILREWDSADRRGAAEHAAAQEIERLQARIDSLMLEFCPNEMTAEQLSNWAKHQTRSTFSELPDMTDF